MTEKKDKTEIQNKRIKTNRQTIQPQRYTNWQRANIPLNLEFIKDALSSDCRMQRLALWLVIATPG